MKILFSEGKKLINYDKLIKTLDKNINKLPRDIILVSIIQYLDYLNKIKDYLNNKGFNTKLFVGKHTSKKGQILGCESLDVGNYLFIGQGNFHFEAIKANILNDHLNKKDFSKYLTQDNSSKTNKIIKAYYLDETSFKEYEFNVMESLKKEILKYNLFLSKKNIGIIITTKIGQRAHNYINLGEELKEKFYDKEFYTILQDNINPNNLMNFSFLDFYINTACPRISIDDSNSYDKPIMNYSNLISLYDYFNNQ